MREDAVDAGALRLGSLGVRSAAALLGEPAALLEQAGEHSRDRRRDLGERLLLVGLGREALALGGLLPVDELLQLDDADGGNQRGPVLVPEGRKVPQGAPQPPLDLRRRLLDLGKVSLEVTQVAGALPVLAPHRDLSGLAHGLQLRELLVRLRELVPAEQLPGAAGLSGDRADALDVPDDAPEVGADGREEADLLLVLDQAVALGAELDDGREGGAEAAERPRRPVEALHPGPRRVDMALDAVAELSTVDTLPVLVVLLQSRKPGQVFWALQKALNFLHCQLLRLKSLLGGSIHTARYT
mmetsp:Transcript_14176/g.33488  ORF Transcript_14176/g.33488 Transcript_14176/m.33488 type:complete len:299 (+) Transcript_14176:527-1423(+)